MNIFVYSGREAKADSATGGVLTVLYEDVAKSENGDWRPAPKRYCECRCWYNRG